MQLTILVRDALVSVDYITLEMDLAPYALELEGMHAVQFSGTSGEIEWLDPERPNDVIYTVDQFQPIIDDHATQLAALQVDTRSEDERRASARAAIDQSAGLARARIASVGKFVEEEYRRAYEVALEHEAAGYPEPAPLSLQTHMDIYGQTAAEAVAEIKARAAAWYAALDVIRDLRLRGKAAVDALPDGSDYDAQALQTINALAALDLPS